MAEAGSFPCSNRALWAAIARMHIHDRADGRGFEAALCERTGWSTSFARRALAEYRRFLFLAATSSAELTPSRAVDEVWHLHLEYGNHYREQLCGRILGRMLDHRPGTGVAADELRFRSQYEATLRFYADVFADPPPEDVWPRSGAAGKRAAPRRARNGRRVLLGLGSGIAAAAVTAAAPSAAGLALAGLAAVLVAIALSPPPPPRLRDGPAGGCGGSCAGGHDGGAGCGGGCGGGCGARVGPDVESLPGEGRDPVVPPVPLGPGLRRGAGASMSSGRNSSPNAGLGSDPALLGTDRKRFLNVPFLG